MTQKLSVTTNVQTLTLTDSTLVQLPTTEITNQAGQSLAQFAGTIHSQSIAQAETTSGQPKFMAFAADYNGFSKAILVLDAEQNMVPGLDAIPPLHPQEILFAQLPESDYIAHMIAMSADKTTLYAIELHTNPSAVGRITPHSHGCVLW